MNDIVATTPSMTVFAVEEEFGMWLRAVERLQELENPAPPCFRLEFRSATNLDDMERGLGTGLAFVSPLTALAISGTDTTLLERLSHTCVSLQSATGTAPFLCSIFRHVSAAGDDTTLRDRIRRWNLAIQEASRVTGAFLVDFDRAFASVGARQLQTDYRMRGREAETMAALVIAETLLRAAPDHVLPIHDRDAALARVGSRTACGSTSAFPVLASRTEEAP